MSSYHEAKARAKIKTVITAVTDVGKVHDYERYANDWNRLQTLFLATNIGVAKDQMLRGWTIGLASLDQERESFGSDGDKLVTYNYKIRGYHAVEDESATDKTFVALVLEVMEALDTNADLQSGDYEDGANSKFAGEYCSRTAFDFRLFAGVLVHYAEIDIAIQENV